MKLLKINRKEGTFNLQSDKFKEEKFRCYFNEEDFDRSDECWFSLDHRHLQQLPNYYRAEGAFGKFRDDPSNLPPLKDELILFINFEENGIAFDVYFKFNLKYGEVECDLKFLVIRKEKFKPPSDMPLKLLNIIVNELNTTKDKNILPSKHKDFKEKMLKYLVDTYLDRLKDFVYYLETINEPICDTCSYLYLKNITGFCKKDYLYKRKRNISE